MTETYHNILAVADFPEDGKHSARINGWQVLICKVETEFFAMNDRCTHAASLLSTGRIRRSAIMCPLHGARFELATGQCLGGSYPALRQFALRIIDGQIEVAVPNDAPGMEDMPVVLG
jgi:anthranilate 1,2-dioxygenase ferredoxin component